MSNLHELCTILQKILCNSGFRTRFDNFLTFLLWKSFEKPANFNYIDDLRENMIQSVARVCSSWPKIEHYNEKNFLLCHILEFSCSSAFLWLLLPKKKLEANFVNLDTIFFG